jgi:hypothetical protein
VIDVRHRRFRVLLWFLIPVVLLAAGFGLPRISLCPRCFSTDTAPIQYGLYMPSEELDLALANHELALGGCVISLTSPARYCFGCGKAFSLTMLHWFMIPAAIISALVIAIILTIKKIRSRRKFNG